MNWRGWVCAAAVCVAPYPGQADAQLTLLLDALRIGEVTAIMREEGLAYAAELDRDMLEGAGGGFWNAQVQQIYDADRMVETVRHALETGLGPSSKRNAVEFFDSALGQQIVEMENASRAAMLDEAVEEAARARCDKPEESDRAHLAQIDRFIESNDLVERNVAGALSSNYQFYAGLVDGNMLEMSETDILREVYGQESDIRAETESWLCGYLLLAYSPLPLQDLQLYVAFYETATGRALNAALFDGYEAMYREISYALGRAVALNAAGDDI